MAEPKPGATAPPRATTTTRGPYRAPPIVSSPDFVSNAPLPAAFRCGSTTGPTISWKAVPKGTKELVVAMFAQKPEADVHWLVTGIPPETASLSGALPAGAVAQVNTFGTAGWTGPCLEPEQSLSYQFEVLALPKVATITPGQTATGLLQQLESQAADARGFLPVRIAPGDLDRAPATSPPGSRAPETGGTDTSAGTPDSSTDDTTDATADDTVDGGAGSTSEPG